MSQKTTPAPRRVVDAGMSQLGAVGGGMSLDPILVSGMAGIDVVCNCNV